MKIKFLLGVLAIGAVTALNSCKDDEVPVAGINFELAEQDVKESDGTPASFHPDDSDGEGVGRVIKAKLVFDIPLAADAVIEIDIDGSARQTSTTNESNDFEIVSEGDNLTVDGTKVTILKGSTEASLNITLFEDGSLEYENDDDVTEDGIPFETIEIKIERVVSGPIKLGEAVEHVIRILEDDTIVVLEWVANNTTTIGDVDMSIWVYVNGQYRFPVDGSSAQYPYEIFLVPAGASNITIGMRYVYDSGTSDDVDFRSIVSNFGGTVTKGGSTGVEIVTPGNYKLVNRHTEADPLLISQTMVKSGFNFTSLTDITVPATGSRVDNGVFTLDYKKVLKSKPISITKLR